MYFLIKFGLTTSLKSIFPNPSISVKCCSTIPVKGNTFGFRYPKGVIYKMTLYLIKDCFCNSLFELVHHFRQIIFILNICFDCCYSLFCQMKKKCLFDGF